VLAAQCIVWHHFAWYGPLAQDVRPLAPSLLDWLADDARKVVQVFLVLGGCMAARALWRDPSRGLPEGVEHGGQRPWRWIARRWWRLVPPVWVALLLMLIATALEQGLVASQAQALGAWPTVEQFMVHALLLQDVLGVPSLSAGLWYVAIDLQLFTCLALVAWILRSPTGHPTAWTLVVLVTATAASAFYFNRDAARFDAFAPYFMVAYGLGALAWWAAVGVRGAALALAAALIVVVAALHVEARDRLMLAVVSAVGLVGLLRMPLVLLGAPGRWLQSLSSSSYVLFLVHYPVLVVVSALWTRWVAPTPVSAALGLALAWGLSMGLSPIIRDGLSTRAYASRTALRGH
jgi:peptidoglycan/LPS O-acetylase OafA/YrhL